MHHISSVPPRTAPLASQSSAPKVPIAVIFWPAASFWNAGRTLGTVVVSLVAPPARLRHPAATLAPETASVRLAARARPIAYAASCAGPKPELSADSPG